MPEIRCPKCGEVYTDAQIAICSKCGTLLFDAKASTVHMRINPNMLRLRQKKELGTTTKIPERTLQLHVRGMVEKLIFEDKTEIVLGRVDLANPDPHRFDLTPYGAHERGVSREHAVLRYGNNEISVTDLKSVNGTSVNGKKLEPNQTQVLKSGDEITLGSLSIVVRLAETSLLEETPAGDEQKKL